MTNKKNQKRKEALAEKSAVETLRFQIRFGLKKLGLEEENMVHLLTDAEADFIAELGMTQDLLSLKSLVDGVRQHLGVTPTPEKGEFAKSLTAIALGIASVGDWRAIDSPLRWDEMMTQKLLTMYYPEAQRNEVVEWVKSNGFTTSTYLGSPIVKFKNINVLIERFKG